jgi:putative transposase
MPGTYACLHYHIVFATEARRPLIAPALATPLHNYLAGIIANLEGHALAIGGTADHLHILTTLGQNRAVSAVVRDLKANSSRWVRATYPEHGDFRWQDGYSAFTVGVAGLERVRSYIAHQEEHHRAVDYQAELIGFLRQQGIECDERHA